MKIRRCGPRKLKYFFWLPWKGVMSGNIHWGWWVFDTHTKEE